MCQGRAEELVWPGRQLNSLTKRFVFLDWGSIAYLLPCHSFHIHGTSKEVRGVILKSSFGVADHKGRWGQFI